MSDYIEFYTSRKPSHFGLRILRLWHKRMLCIAAKYITALHTKNILEIGAGHGLLAEVCQKDGITYAGHEMNIEQAHRLQQSGYDVTPATVPPIPAGKPAHIIWLSHVLEHAATYLDAKAMLLACYNRLETNGHIVIIAPDIHHWKAEFWSVDWSHGFPTSINRVQQLLNEVGFSVDQTLHHTCTCTNPLIAWLLSHAFRLLPVTLIDLILHKITGRDYCHSFMGTFGLRQIFLIGRKE